jgi:hypothetical protein
VTSWIRSGCSRMRAQPSGPTVVNITYVGIACSRS